MFSNLFKVFLEIAKKIMSRLKFRFNSLVIIINNSKITFTQKIVAKIFLFFNIKTDKI